MSSICYGCNLEIFTLGVSVILKPDPTVKICGISCIDRLDVRIKNHRKYCMGGCFITGRYMYIVYSDQDGQVIAQIVCETCLNTRKYLNYDAYYCFICRHRITTVTSCIQMYPPTGYDGLTYGISPLTCSNECTKNLANMCKKTDKTRICTSCGDILIKSKICSGCKMAFYCNQECQRNDWPIHKKLCKS